MLSHFMAGYRLSLYFPILPSEALIGEIEARAFQDWVTRIVLPAIRKDGMYIKGEEKVATGEMTGEELMARKGLAMVDSGEQQTMEGWLLYGAALNEGREMFPGDREYGEWLRSSKLEDSLHPADMSAAIWAAANPQEFSATKKANPRVRTVRGLHAKCVWALKTRAGQLPLTHETQRTQEFP